MKSLLIIVSVFTVTLSAQAQTATIKDIPADGSTNISITKGEKIPGPQYHITEGSSEISGDPEILVKAARDSWKKACEDWKKETKDLNKENQIMAISCNKAKCVTNSPTETVCTSVGTYKIKTKMN